MLKRRQGLARIVLLILIFSVCFMNSAGAIGITEYPLPTAASQPWIITAGPDGNLWFTEFGGNKIGKISTVGVITEYPLPPPGRLLWGITASADGNLWFTEAESTVNKIGKITPAGVITEYPVPTAASGPLLITAGPDGNVWFTELSGNQIAKITPTGVITEFPVPTATSGLWNIAAGPDGNLWFTELYGNNIGKLNPPISKVPAINQWGIIILALVLVLVSFILIDRRHRRKKPTLA
jgi:hypothetical protein